MILHESYRSVSQKAAACAKTSFYEAYYLDQMISMQISSEYLILTPFWADGEPKAVSTVTVCVIAPKCGAVEKLVSGGRLRRSLSMI